MQTSAWRCSSWGSSKCEGGACWPSRAGHCNGLPVPALGTPTPQRADACACAPPCPTAACPAARRSLSAAQDATEFDPLKPEYWARMGDAHKGLGQAPLALLCYEQALKLAPRDEEIQPRCGRRQAACWVLG
jgi:hypothetical protein